MLDKKNAIKREWLEDTLYGRYEVSLTLDVGTPDQALEAARLFRSFIEETDPPRLGHRLRFVLVNGDQEVRRDA